MPGASSTSKSNSQKFTTAGSQLSHCESQHQDWQRPLCGQNHTDRRKYSQRRPTTTARDMYTEHSISPLFWHTAFESQACETDGHLAPTRRNTSRQVQSFGKIVRFWSKMAKNDLMRPKFRQRLLRLGISLLCRNMQFLEVNSEYIPFISKIRVVVPTYMVDHTWDVCRV